jgi:chromosome segregation ATPase
LAKLAAHEQAFAALTPGAHVQEAQKALAAGNPQEKDIKKRTYGRLDEARRHLEAMQRQVKKIDDEAKKLVQEVENREKDLKQYKEVMQKADKERRINKREEAAKELDRDFLSKGFDVKIQLNGSDKTTIKMECVLFNRPMVFALRDKSDFLQNLREAGFEEVVFANKNIKFNWEIDLNI